MIATMLLVALAGAGAAPQEAASAPQAASASTAAPAPEVQVAALQQVAPTVEPKGLDQPAPAVQPPTRDGQGAEPGMLAGPDLRSAPLAARPRANTSRVYLELDAGPSFLHRSGEHGLGSGPLVRFSLGLPLGDAAAAELWTGGVLHSVRGAVGDEGAAGGGIGGRLRLHEFDENGHLSLWGRAGAGYFAATTPAATHGAGGYAGALLLLQPAVHRFALGLALDATAVGGALGFALLPTLRCSL